jgi:hypothetical protein
MVGELLPAWTKELQYTWVLLPLYLLSDLSPRLYTSQTKCTVYTDSVRLQQCRSFTLLFWLDLEPTKFLHHPNKVTSKDDIKGLVSFKFLRPCSWCLTLTIEPPQLENDDIQSLHPFRPLYLPKLRRKWSMGVLYFSVPISSVSNLRRDGTLL